MEQGKQPSPGDFAVRLSALRPGRDPDLRIEVRIASR
jgi:hypothetical protein